MKMQNLRTGSSVIQERSTIDRCSSTVRDVIVENMILVFVENIILVLNILSERVTDSTSEIFSSLKLRSVPIHFSLTYAPLTKDSKQLSHEQITHYKEASMGYNFY